VSRVAAWHDMARGTFDVRRVHVHVLLWRAR
jgi:hypothetical protein